MRLFLFLVLAGVWLSVSPAYARPVSYPGGWTAITENDGDANSLFVHYSPTATTSFGYRLEYQRDQEFTLNAVQMNNLLKRWNAKESQANLYLKTALGVACSDRGPLDGHTQPAGLVGLSADWEDRRFFTSYQNRYTEAGDIGDFFMQSFRIGVAPYVGDYGDLHTWLMLEVKHTPEGEHTFAVTPLLRFFKDVHLVEAGISHHGEILLNYTFRY